jgi:hypothetical protein
MSDQTHYDGCWEDPKHHACALREIERLQTRSNALEAALNHKYGRGDDMTAAYYAGYYKRDEEIATLRAEIERLQKELTWCQENWPG